MPKSRLLDVLWVSLLIFYILMGVTQTPFHGDESTLVYNTLDYAYQFLDRDLSMVTYNGNPAIDPMDQRYRLLDGRVHKYLGGFFWHTAGYAPIEINTPWDWGADWDYNLSAGHLPSSGLLVITRFASAVLMAVGVIAMFGIGMRVEGRAAAYVASALYALSPALLLNGRRSMMEGSLMGFSVLTVLAALYFIDTWRVQHERSMRPPVQRWLSVLLAALLLGLSAGMALSSKLTGVLVVVIGFGALGAYLGVMGIKNRAMALRGILLLSISSVIALGIFYALNPLWWGDPIGRAQQVAETRLAFIQDQISFFDAYTGFGDQLAGFARQVLIAQPQFYEIDTWQSYIGDQVAAYTASPWGGVSLGASLPGLIVLIVLLVLGIVRLARPVPDRVPERWLIGAWAGGMTIALLITTPLEWQRYYLPVLPALYVLAGLGAAQAWALFRRVRL